MPPVEGAIADRTRGLIPITWDALQKDTRYGDALLQTAVDTAKETVFGTVIATAAEPALSLLVIDYTAKLAALEIIPAGIDFWMNEPITETAGTKESHTFTERVEALVKLREILLKETRAAEAEIAGMVDFRRPLNAGIPLLNTMDDDLLTPDPRDFPRPFSLGTA